VRRVVRALAALALAAGASVFAQLPPPPLPPGVLAELPALQRLGEARMRFLGLHVYDISLWPAGGAFAFDRPFALELRYAMNFKGRDISARSIQEMKGLGYADPAKLARWQAEMDRLFPDIKPGDRLVGLHLPGKEARFFAGERPLGAVADPEFARAFFGIWLDEKTSEPKLRLRLLGRPD